MKKLLFTLLLMTSLSIKAAPQWNIYDNLLSSPSFIEQVEYSAKFYARTVLETIVVPSTAAEIKRYNWCQDVISAKANSVIIYRIASFVTNDTYINNLDQQSITSTCWNSWSYHYTWSTQCSRSWIRVQI